MSNKYQPPRFADRILEWYCNPEVLEDLQGALYEYHYQRIKAGKIRSARWMYVLDVLMHCRPHTIKRKSQNSNIMLHHHFKISARNIWKNKLTSSLNVLGLTSGLASFILIMLWVNLEFKFDNFHEQADRIYRIANTFKSESETFSQAISGTALGIRLPENFSEVENGTRFTTFDNGIKVGDQLYNQSEIALVDPPFLDMFSFDWMAGNKRTALQDPLSIVLSESTAKKFFGNENPINKIVSMDGEPILVTGVIADPPQTSHLQFQALMPMNMLKKWAPGLNLDRWGGGTFHTYLLLQEGVDPTALQADLTEFIMEKIPDMTALGMTYEYFLQPMQDIHLQSNLRYDYTSNGNLQSVWILFSVAVLILALACINYINLATASAISRSKEVGIRKVIGARINQLITQHLVESLLIVIISAGFALIISTLALPIFQQMTGYTNLELINSEYILFLLGIILLVSLVAGAFPALMIAKIPSIQVIKGHVKSGAKYNVLRKSLVIVQFASTVVLIISMLVIKNQMDFIQNNKLGMDSDGIYHINYRVSNDHQADLFRDKLLQLPEVSHVSFSRSGYPVGGLGNSSVEIETGDGNRVLSSIYTMQVDEEYLNTFGMTLTAGRFYSKDFPADSIASVVVNEACISSFGWKDAEDALGKKFGTPPNERAVIGVVSNFNFEALYKKIVPLRILPLRRESEASIDIKANGIHTFELVSNIQSIWEEVFTDIPFDVDFMNDDLKDQYIQEYNFRTLFSFFSFLSVIIGCLGLFGLATAATNQRLKEMSIRKVLGASVAEILSLINREFIVLIIAAGAIASPVAYYLMDHWLNNFTYRISFHWQFIAYAILGSLLVAILTISLKALKTAFVNPATILKDE